MLSFSDLQRRNDGYRAMCGFGTTKSPEFPMELEKKKSSTGNRAGAVKTKPTLHK
jgi:hypothetical protein